MRKPALAIGMAIGLSLVSTPVLAGEDLFIVENAVGYTIHASCGPFHQINAGQESGMIPCQWGAIHVMREHFISDAATEVAHNCPDPEKPVHRIRITGATIATTATAGQWSVLTGSHSCESNPLL